MAALTITDTRNTSGKQAPTVNTLTTSDTLTWAASQNVLAHLDNVTAGTIVVTFDGDGGTTVTPSGLGDPIDVSGGYAISLNAGELAFVALSSIKEYLKGNIAVTSDGAGVEATFYQV